jgi:ankyrin repeat protein
MVGGHADIVEMLLGKGADVNQRTADNGSLLGASALYIVAESGHSHVVETLLAHRANASLVTLDIRSGPLHAVSLWGHVDIVKMLINHGVDVEEATTSAYTPLRYAAGPWQGLYGSRADLARGWSGNMG